MPSISFPRFTLLACILLASTFAAGCSSLPSGAGLPLLGAAKKNEAPAEASPQTMCTVEMHGSSKRPKAVQIPITPNTRVQDVLVASKAAKRYSAPDVVLVRQVQGGSDRSVKLACRYDRKENRIAWDSDYAVHPGDRIMVREDKSNPMGSMLNSVTGPFFGGQGK